MSSVPALIVAWTVGVALGVVFFGGLWWTVRRGASSTQPALWFSCSLVLRMSICLTGLYVVSAGRLDRLLICLAGFIVSRVLVTRLTGRWLTGLARSTQETGRAPQS